MGSTNLAALTAFVALFSVVPTARTADAPGAAGDTAVGFQLLVRGVYLEPTTRNTDIPLDGGEYPDFSAIVPITTRWSAELTVSDKTNFSAAQPQGYYGQDQMFTFMVSTVTGRYAPATVGSLRPYVGLGIGYVSVQYAYNNTQGPAPQFPSKSLSAVLQGGFDWHFTEHLFIDTDLRFLPNFNLDYNVPYEPYGHGQLHIRPFLLGLGVGVQF